MTRSTLIQCRDWLCLAASFGTVLFITLSPHGPAGETVRQARSPDSLTVASSDGLSDPPILAANDRHILSLQR